MNDYATCAETAQAIRLALKAQYPAQTFTVRTSTYSGGATVNVSWIDGPPTKEVDALLDRFAGADFDSSQDLKSYRRQKIALPDGRLVYSGCDWVSTSRQSAEEAERSARFRAEWDARKAARKAKRDAEREQRRADGAAVVVIGRTSYQARKVDDAGYVLYGPRGSSVYALRYRNQPELLYVTLKGRNVRLTDADGTLRVREVAS